MIHIRADEELNSKRRFVAAGPDLPTGDRYFFESESQVDRHVDCKACRVALGYSDEPRKLGTPISEMTPARFAEMAALGATTETHGKARSRMTIHATADDECGRTVNRENRTAEPLPQLETHSKAN